MQTRPKGKPAISVWTPACFGSRSISSLRSFTGNSESSHQCDPIVELPDSGIHVTCKKQYRCGRIKVIVLD